MLIGRASMPASINIDFFFMIFVLLGFLQTRDTRK